MTAWESFLALLRGRSVLFAGIGVSHREIIARLAREGLDVTACDRHEASQLGEICGELRGLGVRLLLGEEYPAGFDTDVLFRTPGMYYHAPELAQCRARGVIVTSEMELFLRFCPCPVVAVTGSDGKTTTSSLTAELLRAEGFTVHLGGNIGRALLPELENIEPHHRAVVELSSFQLLSMRCAPQVAVVTNVTPNHLDVHVQNGMTEYIDTKRGILTHQDAFSTTVLSADDEVAASFAPDVRGQLRLFSVRRPVENGAYLGGDGVLRRAARGREEVLLPRGEIRLPGLHNVANLLAAVCAAGDDVRPETAAAVARGFGGVEHRMELTRTLDGVRWYNDSIATSPTRAVAGLESFDGKIILLAGGYDKNLSYDPLAPVLAKKVKLLILTGPTADKIEASLRACPSYAGSPAVLRAKDLPEAVAMARASAKNGDIVSLSPASASFDAYPNFEARGKHFKELVEKLAMGSEQC